jgi:hypothetical protein
LYGIICIPFQTFSSVCIYIWTFNVSLKFVMAVGIFICLFFMYHIIILDIWKWDLELIDLYIVFGIIIFKPHRELYDVFLCSEYFYEWKNENIIYSSEIHTWTHFIVWDTKQTYHFL